MQLLSEEQYLRVIGHDPASSVLPSTYLALVLLTEAWIRPKLLPEQPTFSQTDPGTAATSARKRARPRSPSPVQHEELSAITADDHPNDSEADMGLVSLLFSPCEAAGSPSLTDPLLADSASASATDYLALPSSLGQPGLTHDSPSAPNSTSEMGAEPIRPAAGDQTSAIAAVLEDWHTATAKQKHDPQLPASSGDLSNQQSVTQRMHSLTESTGRGFSRANVSACLAAAVQHEHISAAEAAASCPDGLLSATCSVNFMEPAPRVAGTAAPALQQIAHQPMQNLEAARVQDQHAAQTATPATEQQHAPEKKRILIPACLISLPVPRPSQQVSADLPGNLCSWPARQPTGSAGPSQPQLEERLADESLQWENVNPVNMHAHGIVDLLGGA